MLKSPPKPFLRWAGSKKKLLPELEKFYHEGFNTYIEPFLGSGQLFFRLPVKRAVLSDMNTGLINTYKNVKDHPNEVFNELKKFTKSKEEYYRIREKFNAKGDDIINSALFLYLNAYCFNGIYRTNLSGKFNVPFSEDSGRTIEWSALNEAAAYLSRATLIAGDFENIVLTYCGKNDFVYMDPPYAIKNRRIFNQYGPDSFGLNDIERLKKLLIEINNRNSKFVLSYAQCDEALDMGKDWNTRVVSTVRNISGFAQHRKIENEIIITNI